MKDFFALRQGPVNFPLEELVTGISARMVKALAEELDAEIIRSLKEILVVCGVDRCGLMAVQEDSTQLSVTRA